jgi:hypothetical protein
MRIYTSKSETAEGVQRWFRSAVARLWPVAEGSLSLRRCPCIRKGCAACARGEGHPSYVLYARRSGKRVSLYVPAELAPHIESAIENGRKLQQLINEAGVRYTRALKQERTLKSRK